jgi:hypothetical protein
MTRRLPHLWFGLALVGRRIQPADSGRPLARTHTDLGPSGTVRIASSKHHNVCGVNSLLQASTLVGETVTLQFHRAHNTCTGN